MNTKTRRMLTLLPWLSLPIVAAVHLLLWDRIPEQLAVHFDLSGTPTGWMTRGQSLAFDLAVLLFILVLNTLKLRRQGRHEQQSALLIQNAAVLFITLIFLGLLKYNITGSLF
ncbi:MAG: DUF1648 domain-containing protein [Pyrinomonadaceae bacterium]